jgi:hypothetical protein
MSASHGGARVVTSSSFSVPSYCVVRYRSSDSSSRSRNSAKVVWMRGSLDPNCLECGEMGSTVTRRLPAFSRR